jgi:hypothetical protein
MKKSILLFGFFLFLSLNINAQENELAPFLAKTISGANLRVEPDENSEKKETLKVNSDLYVFSAEETNGYIKCIDIKTNKLGWVKSFAIKKIKDIPLSSSSGFQESGTSSSYDTEVEITNKSSSTISLIVGNNYFSLEPHSTTTEITENGVLYYTASAPGVIPSSGKYKFEQGHKYNWDFYNSYTKKINERLLQIVRIKFRCNINRH